MNNGYFKEEKSGKLKLVTSMKQVFDLGVSMDIDFLTFIY